MNGLKEKIEKLQEQFDEAIESIPDEKSLQEVRNLYLSRSRGVVSALFGELKSLKPEEKPAAGKEINALKEYVQDKLQALQTKLSEPKEVKEDVDLTLPGEANYIGSPHPILIIQQEIENIFLRMGFSVEEGPEIETDYYNFEALNFPHTHRPFRSASWKRESLPSVSLLLVKCFARNHPTPRIFRCSIKWKDWSSTGESHLLT
jgi:phenylalanyl-tRNA synthetase alpha chain